VRALGPIAYAQQQGRVTSLFAKRTAGTKIPIALMVEKEVQTGPSLRARADHDHISKGDAEKVAVGAPATSADAQIPLASAESLAGAGPPFPTPASHTRPDKYLSEVDKKLGEGLQGVWGHTTDDFNGQAVGPDTPTAGPEVNKGEERDVRQPEPSPDVSSEGDDDGNVDSEEEPPKKKKRVSIDKRFVEPKSRSEEPSAARPHGARSRKRIVGTDPLEVEMCEPARKKKKTERLKPLADPYETLILQVRTIDLFGMSLMADHRRDQ